MNAYIELKRQGLAPSDPVPEHPPCSVEEISDEVILKAMNLQKSNPVLDCDLYDLEMIDMDDDQMESDVHVKVINSILSPSRIDAENNDVLYESYTLDVSVVEEKTVSSDVDGAESQSFNLDGDWSQPTPDSDSVPHIPAAAQATPENGLDGTNDGGGNFSGESMRNNSGLLQRRKQRLDP